MWPVDARGGGLHLDPVGGTHRSVLTEVAKDQSHLTGGLHAHVLPLLLDARQLLDEMPS